MKRPDAGAVRSAGERLGRYEIVRLLGEGGSGRVYEAWLHGPGGFRKQVALKVLHPGRSPARLATEARLGGLLRHPNLVEVYALEQIDDTWVIAMELVPGGSLADRPALTPRAVIEVGLQAAAGLAHAHDEIGLVHLDLKPDNLLVRDATIKVGDLGVARAFGLGDGIVRGTPAYMSPEHAAGLQVDARADVWSLGVVLVRLATGQLGRSPAEVPWLRDVLVRCLAPDPSDRFPGMRALAAALASVEVEGPGLAEVLGVAGREPTRTRTSTVGSGSTSDNLTFDAAGRVATNLGAELDATVGREAELWDVEERLARPGIVTIKGTGGIGKTRVARAVARAWHAHRMAEAWLVDLTRVASVESLLFAIGAALDAPIGTGPTDASVDLLGRVLDGRGDVLVVLDGFDQLVEHGAIVGRLAAGAPEARFLVTSRVALALPGEVVVELGPLTEAASLELLKARARRPTDGLEALVRRLDGLPLALELAAARLDLMSPAQLVERLEAKGILRRRGGDRHASLDATLDASRELLDPVDALALASASVFRGGFTLEAADEVWDLAGGRFAADAIEALVRTSLLQVAQAGRAPRFQLLEPVRAWASEALSAEAVERLARRHAIRFAALGHPDRVAVLDAGSGAARAELVQELPNLLAACRWSLAAREPRLAARTAVAVFQVTHIWGPVSLGVELCDAALQLPGLVDEDLGALHHAAGNLRRLQGAPGPAEAHLREAIAAFERAGRPRERGASLGALGVLFERSGRLDEAFAAHEAALVAHRAVGDRHNEGVTLGNLAVATLSRGHAEEARAGFEAAIAACRAAGSRRYVAIHLGNLANALNRLGRTEEARSTYQEALRAHRDVGNRRFEGVVLGNLGVLYGRSGDLAEAARHFEAAIAIHREVGDRRFEAGALANLGECALLLGRYDEAEDALTRAVAIAGDANPGEVVAGRLELANLARWRGDLGSAEAHLEAAIALALQTGDVAWAAVGRVRQAQLRLQAGEAAAALDAVDRALPELEGRLRQATGQAQALRGEIRAALGDPDGADRDHEAALGSLEGPGYRMELLEAWCARARVLAARGDRPGARTALLRAEAWWAELGLPEGGPAGVELARARAAVAAPLAGQPLSR